MEHAYAQALYRAIQAGIDPKKAIAALVGRLERESRSALIPRIARAFSRIALRESSRGATRVYVANGRDASVALEAAAQHAKAGKHDVHLDKTLIGGWRIETGDTLIDNSFKKHLLDIFNRVTA